MGLNTDNFTRRTFLRAVALAGAGIALVNRADAAIGYVDTGHFYGIASGGPTTPPIDTRTANLLVIVVGATAAGMTPSDSLSNTWTSVGTQDQGGVRCQLWYCIGTPNVGASHTVSIGGSNTYAIHFLAFSGASTYVTASGQTNALSPGSLTLGATDLSVCVFVDPNITGAAPTCGALSSVTTVAGAGGSNVPSGVGYAIPGAGGFNPTWSASNLGACIQAQFTAAATSSPAKIKITSGGL